jgi:hypothetical protein
MWRSGATNRAITRALTPPHPLTSITPDIIRQRGFSHGLAPVVCRKPAHHRLALSVAVERVNVPMGMPDRAVDRPEHADAGTSPNWVKVKNPKHPAIARVKEAFDAKARNRH